MKRAAFAVAAIVVAASALTVSGIATAADQSRQPALSSVVQATGPAPQRVLASRPLMLRVPSQRVAGITSHVAPSCTGDGTDGQRVQVLYVRSAADPALSGRTRATILDEVRTVDDVFAASAAKTGGGLRVRWVHGADCVPVVEDVVVSSAALADTFDVMHAELRAQGYDRADRKYLVFSESRRNCGMSDGNVPASISRVDALCWPTGSTSYAAHELGHGLGAVAGDAPHASGHGHCTETGDLMCNGQHSPDDPVVRACPAWQGNWFDCGDDDYFSTSPEPGSYLDSDRNIARSPFLDTVEPLPSAPQVAVTARPAPRSARLRAGQGQVVVVHATSSTPVAGWEFPSVAGKCRLTSAAGGPQLRARAGTATYSCLQNRGTAAAFTVQALGFDQRVGYGTAEVVLRTPPVSLRFSRKPAAGRTFQVVAVGGRDADPSYWWNGVRGCRQGTRTGARARFTCPPSMSGRTVTVRVSVYPRNGWPIRVSRQVVLTRA